MRTRIDQAYPSAAVVEEELNRLAYRAKCRRLIAKTFSTTLVYISVLFFSIHLWFPILLVYGNSMFPALQDGDVVLCIKTKDASQGDIITFYHNNKLLVKRVIGLSGDDIDIDSRGGVLVNHSILYESYIAELSHGVVTVELPIQVPNDAYFVLGDRRATSLDSRSQEVGCIPKERVLGKVLFRLWPLTRFGPI